MGRGIFLNTTTLERALALWRQQTDKQCRPSAESIDVRDALGRLTAEAVFARISNPFYHSSAMDGYAIRFHETFGASETSPVKLTLGQSAIYVDTGDPVPEGFNAVVMVEHANVEGGRIEILEAATPWQHIRVVGEDIVEQELIAPENHRVRAVDIGAMLAGGLTEIKVRRRPVVAIIPTGTEMVEPGGTLERGQIIEYNSRTMEALVTEWGGAPLRLPIVPDDPDALAAAVTSAIEKADIVIINAGASSGSEDYTASTISRLGTLSVHGLAIKPGKPMMFGSIKDKPVLGIPGYPVSTFLTFNLFARPAVERMLGLEPSSPPEIEATLSRQVASPLGVEEFIRVKVGSVSGKLIATPLSRGAGLMMSLVRADGIISVPPMQEGLGAGAGVRVKLLRDTKEIENTVVMIGSHDNALDLLANRLKQLHPGFSLSSSHVGSMGGLVALKRGEAHVAPTHLLDEETQTYNVPFIKRLLEGRGIMLVNLVGRTQGLMVRPSNEKGIRGIKDLRRKDVTFINRQRGSGTRLLLDKCLRDAAIDPSEINGYGNEEYTHMSVASAVISGVADTGLGVLSAARALGLDFIPIADEQYDLAFDTRHLEFPPVKALLECICENAGLRKSIEALGGYDVSNMGRSRIV